MIPILRLGSYGALVSEFKMKLIKLGWPLNDEGLNKGAFGPKTEQVVKDFQRSRGLTADGEVGPLTQIAIDRAIWEKFNEPVIVSGPPPIYWKPGPYHPMFAVPAGYTHLHPIDVLRSYTGEKEIYGSRDNPKIAHFHEHSGNLGTHSETNDYSDEVPHCSSALCFVADGAGCEKTNHALASSWDEYPERFGAREYKIGEVVPAGSIIRIKDGNHVTLANRSFLRLASGSFEGFGSNQSNTIKTSSYPQSRIVTVCDWKPKPGTRLAPIGTQPVPATGVGNESTR